MHSPANILTTSRLWSCCSQSPHFLSQISVAKPLPLAEKVPKWNPFPSPAHFSGRKRQALSVIDNVSFFKHFTQPFESVPRCQQWYYLLISKSTGAPLCLFSILILHSLTSTQCWSHPLQRQTCLPFFFSLFPILLQRAWIIPVWSELESDLQIFAHVCCISFITYKS